MSSERRSWLKRRFVGQRVITLMGLRNMRMGTAFFMAKTSERQYALRDRLAVIFHPRSTYGCIDFLWFYAILFAPNSTQKILFQAHRAHPTIISKDH
jgi:hypothetical protein